MERSEPIADDADAETGTTLASTVYIKLRHDILCGSLVPGEKLRAEYLRDRYKVGNSPVREALNRLSADGLVVREDQKGFRVSTVSVAELRELTKTRCWLEGLALSGSIEKGGTDWEERLILAFHRLSKLSRSSGAGQPDSNPEWERRHGEFHMALIAGCDSPLLLDFCRQLNDTAGRYRRIAFKTSYPERDETTEHKSIVDATVARDADRAVELLQQHYRRTEHIILETSAGLLRDAAAPTPD